MTKNDNEELRINVVQQAEDQKAEDQKAEDQKAAALKSGPTISSSVGAEDKTVDDPAIADAIKACDNKNQALKREIQENKKERANKHPGETPRDFATAYLIALNGHPFEPFQDLGLKFQLSIWEKRKETLQDPEEPHLDKMDTVNSIKIWNSGAKKLGGESDSIKRTLEKKGGLIGKGVAALGTVVGIASDFCGVTECVNGAADGLYGAFKWVKYNINRKPKALEPIAEKPVDQQSVNNSDHEQVDESEQNNDHSIRGIHRRS